MPRASEIGRGEIVIRRVNRLRRNVDVIVGRYSRALCRWLRIERRSTVFKQRVTADRYFADTLGQATVGISVINVINM